MKAYIATENGPQLSELEIPAPRRGMVQVKVAAAALNRVDLAMAKGYQHGTEGGLGRPLGLEWSGVITAIGEGVEGLSVGDRVMGMGGGAFAEFVTVYPFQLSRTPDAMDDATAATLPVALRTMHNALATAGWLKSGERVLIQGASTGVGLVGLQIAKHLGASLVVGTSTTPERVARLGDYGADLALNSRDPAWVQAVLDETDGAGVDLVIDQVSGELLNQTLRATRVLGRIVNVGRLGGNMAPFDAETLAMRRISLIGVTFRTRTRAELVEINTAMLSDLGEGIAAGAFHVPVAGTFPFGDLAGAIDLMASNAHFGKITLRL